MTDNTTNHNNPNEESMVVNGRKLSIEEYLDQDEKKDLLRLLTAGSVDDTSKSRGQSSSCCPRSG